jgi:hypothetical protein
LASREPLITAATITGAVTAVLALLVEYGIDITDGQQQAILAVVAVAAPLIVALAARRKVTPVADPRADDGTPLIVDLDS